MQAIARFVSLDLRTLRPNAGYMIIPFGLVVVPVLLISGVLLPALSLDSGGGGGYLLIPFVSALAVMSAPQSLFSYDALGRLDTLYTALCIPRRRVVVGRYATCLLLLFALTVLSVLLTALAALAFGSAFDLGVAAALAAGSIAILGVLLAAQLPVFFATGPGPIRVLTAVPPSIILGILAIGWVTPDIRTVLLSWLGDANLGWLALASVGVLGILAAASIRLSARLYARRDL
ncbi:ABC-2 transporter permease [Solwaraspora sp. WMMD1047]|uniref:ABC-2 transporter permease n=1 Tax=Solwaraspora sp. WMMD1047 TaxID=3016102 RepID=UPI002417A731|nr:ABC-2 transporter permease [Solwaraspora sp. WMMD1047]MDG4832840.1 ABC-2 transporter permease [Solwaraspora sp. WMMD1047]